MTLDRSRRGREPALNLLTTVAYVNGSILVFVAVAMVTAAVVSAALFGRFFCSWGCHILALEDLCAWLLARVRADQILNIVGAV